jgi:ubiquinone/menaquinone biosynthesis C-methylase UbiE
LAYRKFLLVRAWTIFTEEGISSLIEKSRSRVIFWVKVKLKGYPDSYYGGTAQKYFEERSSNGDWQKEQSIISNFLSKEFEGLTVLDVPFGIGRFVDMYLRNGMQVYGLDISEDMIAASKNHLGDSFNNCKISIGSAICMPYENDFFDLIVCTRFLQHLRPDTAKIVLSELHRVAKFNSKVILNVNIHSNNKPSNIPRKINKLDRLDGKINENELISLFTEAGFAIDKKIIYTNNPNSEIISVFYIIEKNMGV